jgi:glycosyltransferase involved in cell wall biosynthesis
MQLSVIVPVYNVEKYLDDCLSSLAKQDFVKGEHEVIVVNDGSPDGSEKIIDKYCR